MKYTKRTPEEIRTEAAEEARKRAEWESQTPQEQARRENALLFSLIFGSPENAA